MKYAGALTGIAVLALVLATSLAAASKPNKLTTKTAKGPLTAGDQVVGTSTNLTFVTSAGNLECSLNVITGTDKTNNAAKVEGTITEESSTGHEEGNLCKTTTPLGPAEIKSTGFPWPTIFTDKGVNEVKGSKKVVFTSVFPKAGVTCVFEASKVKSSFNVGGPTKLQTKNQVFKQNKKTSGPACPKEGKLTGEWTVTSDGETVESELT
jgi:hypothetical protein